VNSIGFTYSPEGDQCVTKADKCVTKADKCVTKADKCVTKMIKKLLLSVGLILLPGCADLQWAVEPGPEGISPIVEAAGAASIALVSNSTLGPAGWVLGGVGAALAAAGVILRRKATK